MPRVMQWVWVVVATVAPSVALADVPPLGGGCGCVTVSAGLPPLVLLMAVVASLGRRR